MRKQLLAFKIILAFVLPASVSIDVVAQTPLHMLLAKKTSSVIVYDTDAQAFFTALETDASPVTLNSTQKGSINTLVLSLKTAGVWAKCKAIYPMIGGTASSHKYNLKDPRDLDAAYRLTFIGGTHSSNGVDWNGSSELADTHMNAANTLGQFSTHLSYYSRDNTSYVGGEMGCFENSNANRLALLCQFSDGNAYGEANSGATLVSGANANSTGFYCSSRTSSTSLKIYKNGAALNTVTTTETAALPSVNIFIGGINVSGGTDSYTDRQCAFASIGDGIDATETGALNSAVQAFQTANSR